MPQKRVEAHSTESKEQAVSDEAQAEFGPVAPGFSTSQIARVLQDGRVTGVQRRELVQRVGQKYGNQQAQRLARTVQRSKLATTIQRNPPAATASANIQKLDELLDKFDVPEEEVITLLGKLTPQEKTTVLSGNYKKEIASALNVEEMVRAVNNLGPVLSVKLEWVGAAAGRISSIDYKDIRAMIQAAPQDQKNALNTTPWRGFFVDVCNNDTMKLAVGDLGFDLSSKLQWLAAEMSLDYKDVKNLIVNAPQEQKNVLKTNQWRSFFTDVCNNRTMAEAVTDLGFDLVTKLDWMVEEGTNGDLVSGVIKNAPTTELASVASNPKLLERLKSELSSSDYKAVQKLVGVGDVSTDWEEKDVGGETYGMTSYYSWRITNSAIEVTVKINFKDGGEQRAAIINKTFEGIKKVWNSFKIKKDGSEENLDLIFIPTEASAGSDVSNVKLLPGNKRSDAGNWYMDNPDLPSKTAPHEFGHMIGLEDEYQRSHTDYKRLTGDEAPTGTPATPEQITKAPAIATDLHKALHDDSGEEKIQAKKAYEDVVVANSLKQGVLTHNHIMPSYQDQFGVGVTEDIHKQLSVSDGKNIEVDLSSGKKPLDTVRTWIAEPFTYTSTSLMGNKSSLVPNSDKSHEHGVEPRHVRQFVEFVQNFKGGTWKAVFK
jgi:hypothetical protein